MQPPQIPRTVQINKTEKENDMKHLHNTGSVKRSIIDCSNLDGSSKFRQSQTSNKLIAADDQQQSSNAIMLAILQLLKTDL